jgi:Na+/proline symporter
MDFIDLLSFSGVIALLVAIGIYKSKLIQSESAYLFAERKTKWGALTATLVMTEFNSATLISFASLGYIAGYWALALPFIFLIGLLFYAVTVAKKWKEFDGLSVAGFFSQRFGKNMGTFASVLLLLAMLGFSAAYIKSLILLFQPIFPSVEPWMLSTALLGVVFVMSLRGGLIAIIRTDMLSMILMLLFFPLIAWIMWHTPSFAEAAPLSLAQGQAIVPPHFIVSLIILTMFTYILAPWYGQKIFAAESPKVAYWSVVAAAILVFFLYGLAIFATALFREKGFECTSAEQAFPALIDRCLPFGLKGIAYALLFATSATTLTGVWSAMSAMLIGDFLKTRSEGCGRGILATIGFAAVSLLLANTLVDSVFSKLILANIPVAALSFSLLAGFYWKRASWQGVSVSILVGCFCGVGSYLFFGEEGGYTWYWTVYGIPLTFLVGILGSLCSRELGHELTHAQSGCNEYEKTE